MKISCLRRHHEENEKEQTGRTYLYYIYKTESLSPKYLNSSSN